MRHGIVGQVKESKKIHKHVILGDEFTFETILHTFWNAICTIIIPAMQTNQQLNPSKILYKMVQHSLKTVNFCQNSSIWSVSHTVAVQNKIKTHI
jgi:hypothetical protein